MDTGAQDAALGATREAMVQYLIDHEDRYPRADQLVVHVDYHDLHGWLDALDAAEARQSALVALAHELVELEHGARRGQMRALHRLGIVVTLDEHLARARAFAEQQHARIAALAASPAPDGVAGEERDA